MWASVHRQPSLQHSLLTCPLMVPNKVPTGMKYQIDVLYSAIHKQMHSGLDYSMVPHTQCMHDCVGITPQFRMLSAICTGPLPTQSRCCDAYCDHFPGFSIPVDRMEVLSLRDACRTGWLWVCGVKCTLGLCPVSWHRISRALGIYGVRWVRGASLVILNKPLLNTPEFKLMRWV